MYPQWVLWVGLLPISIYFFKQISWVSFIVNFLAVPFFSFIILPVLFFTFCIFCLWLCVLNGDLFFLNAIKFFFKFNNDLMTLLWNLLNFFSGLGFSHWNVPYSENLFTLFLGVLGSVFLLSPRLGFYRYFGLFGWFAMI